ncbi:ParB N-terminal domain-containing protein [Sphingomonas sp. DT-51]|uniref:ParB N-terminal domain-containing protein n=1 Tax=Sphingomonas sp. DT-51 TaxID=3396165 RepID=UPI003F1A1C76
MTSAALKWTKRVLPIAKIEKRRDFQLRVNGTSPQHVTKLMREMQAGQKLPAVKVALVNGGHFLVDGFHRLEAHKRNQEQHIDALVAHMDLKQALQEARLANTGHGKPLSRADRNAIWEAHVAAGEHRGPDGVLKSPRALAAELHNILSRETIRQRLREMGLEAELEPVKAWGPAEPDAAALAAERREEADDLVLRLGGLLVAMGDGEDRREVLEALRGIVGAVEAGEVPAALQDLSATYAAQLGIE